MTRALPIPFAVLALCTSIACTEPRSDVDDSNITDETSTDESSADETTSTDATTTDTGNPEGAQCQADQQDCPEGYKCLLRLGSSDWEFVCLPVLGDNEIGESCMHDGVVAGTDDCDSQSWCIGSFDVEGNPWAGICYPFCVGGSCSSMSDRCVGIGMLPICAPICDPLLAGSCASEEACIYRPPEGFVCFPAGAEGKAIGEPCTTGVSCVAGLHCAQKVAGCGPDEFCCTDYCDTNNPENTCAAQDQGAECAAIGASDPDQAHVGACVIPD